MKLLCMAIGHHRSRRKIWHDGDDWRSQCTRCQADLMKTYPSGRWRAVPAAPMPPRQPA